MRTILDVDYGDLCLSGHGDVPALEQLFHSAKAAGFDSMLWAPMVCGKALYPSRVAEPLSPNYRMDKGAHHFAELIGKFDPLEVAVRLAREFELELLFYFRLFDDYYPGLEERFFEGRPDLWWQSRCGNFHFKGWPCYHQPEVREYKMRLFREMAAYGPDGFLMELARSHSPYTCPQRTPHFFGYDAPVAEEYQRRYSVDIRAFDYVEPVLHNDGIYSTMPYSYSVDYKNCAEFDREAWHWLKGESVDSFVREARTASNGTKLLLQGGYCPPHPVAEDEPFAKFYVDANRLAADGVIDGFSHTANFRGEGVTDIDAAYFPYFQGVRDAGVPFGGWLNDILTADGGHGRFASIEPVEQYIDLVRASSLDYVIVHEADFIVCHERADEVWQAMARFKD